MIWIWKLDLILKSDLNVVNEMSFEIELFEKKVICVYEIYLCWWFEIKLKLKKKDLWKDGLESDDEIMWSW